MAKRLSPEQAKKAAGMQLIRKGNDFERQGQVREALRAFEGALVEFDGKRPKLATRIEDLRKQVASVEAAEQAARRREKSEETERPHEGGAQLAKSRPGKERGSGPEPEQLSEKPPAQSQSSAVPHQVDESLEVVSTPPAQTEQQKTQQAVHTQEAKSEQLPEEF